MHEPGFQVYSRLMTHVSSATTHGIRIEAQSFYLPDRSDPEDFDFLFGYRIRISNVGSRPAKLVSRHWTITNADGRIKEVRGPGVVGKTPHLMPGQAFEYTSFCPLDTTFGTMHGTYQMVRDGGECFDAKIETFTLAQPSAIN